MTNQDKKAINLIFIHARKSDKTIPFMGIFPELYQNVSIGI